MRIDAHQHFWRPERGDYGWLTPAKGPIYRDFGPDDIAPLLKAGGIDRSIVVQAAPTVEETRFLLELAAATPFVAGVVGWADFEAAGAADQVAALAADRLLVGLRPMLQDIPYPDWILDDNRRPVLKAMQRAGLVFDALVRPVHLSRVLVIADRHPDLAIVVDHGAKPPVADGVLDPWRADMAALAMRPNVSCKLSGLLTEAGGGDAAERVRPYIDHLLETFGPTRLLFGSDWPVLTLAATYADWLALAGACTMHLSPDERAAIFGGNAARVYLHRRGRRRDA